MRFDHDHPTENAMNTSTFEIFQAQAQAEGFDEVIVREWAPYLELTTHTHPFDVSAYVARGEYWLTTNSAVKHLKAGDTFRLARHVPHAEIYGPEGATVWVARANSSGDT
jgi:quercetin dioxygenase-like cupin family protein